MKIISSALLEKRTTAEKQHRGEFDILGSPSLV